MFDIIKSWLGHDTWQDWFGKLQRPGIVMGTETVLIVVSIKNYRILLPLPVFKHLAGEVFKILYFHTFALRVIKCLQRSCSSESFSGYFYFKLCFLEFISC